VFAATVLFALTTVTPLAQTKQLPSPTTYITDPANVIDPQIRTRLESMLAGVKEKTKIELYVAVVETTGAADISAFSQKLANDWRIGAKNSPRKTLLLVISADSKSSFTQFSRAVQTQLPDGVLGEMSYRMREPLSDGRFTEAIDGGVRVFVNALAEKVGFNAADLETQVVAVDKAATPADSPETILVSAQNGEKTRPRVVADKLKTQEPQPTPPAESPEAPAENPKSDPAATEPLKIETPTTEAPKTESAKPPRRNLTAKGTTTVKPTSKKPGQDVDKKSGEPVQVEDEEETVSLTLVLPVGERVGKLKEFLDTHPESKERARAIEYLVSAHAAVGDQKLKNGDSAGGVEQLLVAIDAADPSTTADNLFSGVIAQIPTNLYLRGERAAAFKAAQNIETKFGSDPKRLLAVAGFYLGIERGDEAVRIAESAIKLAPDLAEAHRMLALGHHISLRLDEAAAEYKKTLELDPASKVSRISLADLYRASGKSELALALYNEQLASDPKDRAARAGKVIALLDLSRTEEANAELEAALTDEPRNLPLLSGAAYWFASHGNNEKAFDLARKAIAIESRYTWAQIALARAYLGLKQPLDAERAMRYARQYGKFPTLNYELANVLASMGFYQESADVLRESFEIKDGQIHTRLAGHLPVSDPSFIDLLAPERRAGIYQSSSADTAENARILKALLAFNTAITPAEGEKIDESAATAAAQEFGSGTDSMRAFRQLYAANRLLRNGVGASMALELVAAAKKASDDALKVPVLTMAVQADEFRDLRARAIASGSIPDVAEAPHDALARILKGRIADLEGLALFNQEKYSDAIQRLKVAAETLPVNTPAWRSALWHLGAVHEQTGEKQKALDYYLQSYTGGEPDAVRRSVIEQLYKNVNGSLDGLESKLSGVTAEAPKTEPAPTEAPKTEPAAPTETPKTEPATSTETPKTEPAPVSETPKETSQPQGLSDESLRAAASRLRTNIRITGRILDANQVPIANVTVVLISPSGSVIAATTDDNGKYSFTAAPSQKTYRVIPSKDGYSFTPLDRTLAALIEDQRQVDFVGSKP
jgi:Flp pilus assembly protein TadD